MHSQGEEETTVRFVEDMTGKPGKFSALPAKASAMYAPELKGNSDEIKLSIED